MPAGRASVIGSAPGGVPAVSHRPGQKVEIGGQLVELRPHPMCCASMFACPKCGANRYRLYEVSGVWACRECHGLDYQSRHRNRSIPGLARLLCLRRWINAEPRPFGSLPPPPRVRVARYNRYVAEIDVLEKALSVILAQSTMI